MLQSARAAHSLVMPMLGWCCGGIHRGRGSASCGPHQGWQLHVAIHAVVGGQRVHRTGFSQVNHHLRACKPVTTPIEQRVESGVHRQVVVSERQRQQALVLEHSSSVSSTVGSWSSSGYSRVDSGLTACTLYCSAATCVPCGLCVRSTRTTGRRSRYSVCACVVVWGVRQRTKCCGC